MENYIPVNFIKGLIKNSLALVSVKILEPLSSFIVVLLISRNLGASILGIYIIAYNFYIIFHFITLLGLETFVTREVAKDKSKASKYLVNIGFIGFVSSIICFILVCLVVYLMNYPSEIREVTYLIGLALLPSMGILLCEEILVAFEKVKYLLFAIIVEAVSKVSLSLFVLSLRYGINALMIVIIISKILGLVTVLYFIMRYIGRLHLEIDFTFCRKILKEIVPVFVLSTVLYNVLVRIDVVILSKFRETIEVGWYGPASKFFWIGNIFISSLIITIFPIMSRLFVNSRDIFEKICRKFLKYISILLPLMVIITVFLSDKLILLFFGKEFMNSVIALKILICSILPVGWAVFCSRILIAGNNQRMDFYALGITLGTSFILNLFLSYRYGYVGTSIAVLISMSIWAISEYLFVYKYMFNLNILQIAAKPFISAAIIIGFMSLFRQQLNQFIIVILSLIIYFLFLFILRTFPKEDIILIQKLCKPTLES